MRQYTVYMYVYVCIYIYIYCVCILILYTCAIQELWLGICRSTAFWPDSLPHLVLPAVLHTFPSRLRSRCFSCEKCAAQKLIGRYNAIQPVVPVFKEPCHYVGKHYLSSRPNGRWGKQRKTCRGICEMHEAHCAKNKLDWQQAFRLPTNPSSLQDIAGYCRNSPALHRGQRNFRQRSGLLLNTTQRNRACQSEVIGGCAQSGPKKWLTYYTL